MEVLKFPVREQLWTGQPDYIYCEGNTGLLKEMSVAVIGTRQPTLVGSETARRIAYALAKEGFVVLSGLALGCDKSAHQGALEAGGGRTIAVLPGPLDDITPRTNQALATRIVQEGGLLLSPFQHDAMNQQERIARYIWRDYLQAALATCVIPVQAGLKSGTQHATGWAMEHNRKIAIPEPIKQDQERNPEKYAYIDALKRRKDTFIIGSREDYPALRTFIKH